ncbi:MAG: hypothetical protein FWG89_00880 [Treponema sp.]|nr:hypothetical protein [Treponema sp.]
MKKKRYSIILALVALGLIAGCSNPFTPAPSQGGQVTNVEALHRMQGFWNMAEEGSIWFSLAPTESITISEGIRGTVAMRLEFTSEVINLQYMGTSGRNLSYLSYEQWVLANRNKIGSDGYRLLNLANDGSNPNSDGGPPWAFRRLDEMTDGRRGSRTDGVVVDDWDILSFINASSPQFLGDRTKVPPTPPDSTLELLDGTFKFYEYTSNRHIGTMRFFFIRDMDRSIDRIVVYDYKEHIQFASYNIPEIGIYERDIVSGDIELLSLTANGFPGQVDSDMLMLTFSEVLPTTPIVTIKMFDGSANPDQVDASFPANTPWGTTTLENRQGSAYFFNIDGAMGPFDIGGAFYVDIIADTAGGERYLTIEDRGVVLNKASEDPQKLLSATVNGSLGESTSTLLTLTFYKSFFDPATGTGTAPSVNFSTIDQTAIGSLATSNGALTPLGGGYVATYTIVNPRAGTFFVDVQQGGGPENPVPAAGFQTVVTLHEAPFLAVVNAVANGSDDPSPSNTTTITVVFNGPVATVPTLEFRNSTGPIRITAASGVNTPTLVYTVPDTVPAGAWIIDFYGGSLTTATVGSPQSEVVTIYRAEIPDQFVFSASVDGTAGVTTSGVLTLNLREGVGTTAADVGNAPRVVFLPIEGGGESTDLVAGTASVASSVNNLVARYNITSATGIMGGLYQISITGGTPSVGSLPIVMTVLIHQANQVVESHSADGSANEESSSELTLNLRNLVVGGTNTNAPTVVFRTIPGGGTATIVAGTAGVADTVPGGRRALYGLSVTPHATLGTVDGIYEIDISGGNPPLPETITRTVLIHLERNRLLSVSSNGESGRINTSQVTMTFTRTMTAAPTIIWTATGTATPPTGIAAPTAQPNGYTVVYNFTSVVAGNYAFTLQGGTTSATGIQDSFFLHVGPEIQLLRIVADGSKDVAESTEITLTFDRELPAAPSIEWRSVQNGAPGSVGGFSIPTIAPTVFPSSILTYTFDHDHATLDVNFDPGFYRVNVTSGNANGRNGIVELFGIPGPQIISATSIDGGRIEVPGFGFFSTGTRQVQFTFDKEIPGLDDDGEIDIADVRLMRLTGMGNFTGETLPNATKAPVALTTVVKEGNTYTATFIVAQTNPDLVTIPLVTDTINVALQVRSVAGTWTDAYEFRGLYLYADSTFRATATGGVTPPTAATSRTQSIVLMLPNIGALGSTTTGTNVFFVTEFGQIVVRLRSGNGKNYVSEAAPYTWTAAQIVGPTAAASAAGSEIEILNVTAGAFTEDMNYDMVTVIVVRQDGKAYASRPVQMRAARESDA